MSRLSTRNIYLFFRQLSTLLSADIPVVQAFDLLGFDKKNKTLSRLTQMIKRDMEAGKPLSLCLRRFPLYFDTTTCQIIEIGEHSGTLPIVLGRLALHREKQDRFRKKIVQTLTYPVITLIVAVITVLTLVITVIPRFVELFQRAHAPLPFFTQSVIAVSDSIRSHPELTLSPAICIFCLYFIFLYSRPSRRFLEKILFAGPFGATFMKSALAHFAHHLSIMIGAGIPLVEALKQLIPITKSLLYQYAIAQCCTGILRGHALHDALQKNSLFLPMVVSMVKIGEESGRLESMLKKIGDIYDADIEEEIKQMTILLEPLIMIILGVLIGGLVIAMYLPIFKLGTAIQ